MKISILLVMGWLYGCGAQSINRASGVPPEVCTNDQKNPGVNPSNDKEVPKWIKHALRKHSAANLSLYNIKSSFGTTTFGFSVNGTKVCQAGFAARIVKNQGVLIGHAPAKGRIRTELLRWQNLDEVSKSLEKGTEIISGEKCLKILEERSLPAWELIVKKRSLPYRITYLNDEVVEEIPLYFNVKGQAAIFERNPESSQIIMVELDELDDSGFLCSPRFETFVPGEFSRARSFDGDHNYEVGTDQFIETSVFANAELMTKWLMKPDFELNWRGPPISLHIHDDLWGQTQNNAMYIPGEFLESKIPEIRLGDGDGIGLINLAIDSDVVSHEVAHHFIYEFLQPNNFEAQVLHEGLADFFTFASRNDPCLGQTICPKDSPFCWKEQSCLRTAENDLNFLSSDLPIDKHQQSQLISGMLWDLNEKDHIDLSVVARIVVQSLKLLQHPSADYRDFLVALLNSDLEYFDGVHSCTIIERALARGFEKKLAGLSCEQFMPVSTRGEDQ